MFNDENVFEKDERAMFALRKLYSSYGYTKYRMSKFEEYDFYAKNKGFLISDNILTFTDADGKLMALKPDVTLSIVKNSKDTQGAVQKVYYNENVYRASGDTGVFKEIMQVGLECIGDLDGGCVSEVVMLAAKSLECISADYVLDISHMGIISEAMDAAELSAESQKAYLSALGEKNLQAALAVCKAEELPQDTTELLTSLVTVYGEPDEVISRLKAFSVSGGFLQAVNQLADIFESLKATGCQSNVKIDFSVANSMKYYSGVAFKGFINGIPGGILSGGQYDKLLQKMNRRSGAIGFAVYLDLLERLEAEEEEAKEAGAENTSDARVLNIALPKGRLGEKVYGMFEKAGFECPSIKEESRKLIFENEELKIRYFWVKPSDVAIYVEHGAADIGVAGKDILLEYEPQVYELLDLCLGKCRMAVAGKKDFSADGKRTLRVATKFANIAKNYYKAQGREIDIIHLNGSIELAPILGLSDVIVDIVETGTTLKENNLEVKEEIVPISARLIANKASFKFKNGQIEKILKSMMQQVEERKND
ncbi:MAG: ATP phosphoribosyltransferase [Clostridia bacterium]|nr:ATP phosphoribosyltransferase [Clostridia bacterium]